MQYIWSHHEEYAGKLKGWKRWLFDWITPRLRKWDLQYREFDKVVFNSQYTAQLAKELYGMEGEVRYPKV
ncbi:MAG: hypothetical protein Q4B28_01900 [bacterium]|nr:hypothetical protein [bacterium]